MRISIRVMECPSIAYPLLFFGAGRLCLSEGGKFEYHPNTD